MIVNLHSGTTAEQLKVQKPEPWRACVYDTALILPIKS